MDIKKLTQEVLLKNMTPEQQLAVLESVTASVKEAKAVQKQKIAENVDLVLQALKRIEADMLKRVDGSAQIVEARVKTIKDGKDGKNGLDGKPGKDGINGKDGKDGRDGRDGLNGKAGERGQDGVGVQDAHIDFDGSLIISLTNGQELNVGEVVPFDVAEKIRVIGNGGGTSQYVLDTLASLQTQINNFQALPTQTGNAGKFLTTDGTTASWASVAGGLSYQGTWNASTNTPTLASSTGTNGYYYVVNTAGSTNLNGITDWQIGDWLLFNGSAWQKIDQTNSVTSVAGRTGAVTLSTSDISGLGTIATQNANNVAITGGLISGTTLSGATIDNSAPYLTFADGSATTVAAGRMWYNGSEGSWNLGMGNGNITQQIGEELFRYGKASSAITDSPLQLVYKTGTVGASGVITFAPAVAGITDANNILGCATENIALNGFGRITTYGIIHGITTNGTAYGETWADNDDIYYNPTTGGLTKTQPSAPALKMLVGTVIKAGSGGSGSFIVKLGVATYLSALSDVQITSAATSNLIQYDGSKWINVAPTTLSLSSSQITTALGYTPYNSTNPSGYTSNTGTVTSVGGTGTVNGLTLTGTVTSSGNLTLGGTLSNVANSALTNSAITFGSTSQALGSTVSAINGVSLGQSTPAAVTGTVVTGSSVVASNGIVVNSNTINSDYTIASGNNGGSFGPVSVASGVTVTISSGSVWTIV